MATTKTIMCPDCGLALKLVDSKFVYDVKKWRRGCVRVELDSPVWCLILRDATSKPQ